jgi:hypothetical protein
MRAAQPGMALTAWILASRGAAAIVCWVWGGIDGYLGAWPVAIEGLLIAGLLAAAAWRSRRRDLARARMLSGLVLIERLALALVSAWVLVQALAYEPAPSGMFVGLDFTALLRWLAAISFLTIALELIAVVMVRRGLARSVP